MLNALVLVFAAQLVFGQDIQVSSSDVILPDNFELHIGDPLSKGYPESGLHPGILFYPDGNQREYDSIRYDLRNERLIVIINQKELTMLPGVLTGFLIKESFVQGHLFLVQNIENMPKYLEVLSAGYPLLLAHYYEKAKDEEMKKILKVDVIRLEKKQEVLPDIQVDFYIVKNNVLRSLKPNKKSVIKSAGFSKAVVDNYLDSSVVKFQDPVDLKALFDRLNHK